MLTHIYLNIYRNKNMYTNSEIHMPQTNREAYMHTTYANGDTNYTHTHTKAQTHQHREGEDTDRDRDQVTKRYVEARKHRTSIFPVYVVYFSLLDIY